MIDSATLSCTFKASINFLGIMADNVQDFTMDDPISCERPPAYSWHVNTNELAIFKKLTISELLWLAANAMSIVCLAF